MGRKEIIQPPSREDNWIIRDAMQLSADSKIRDILKCPEAVKMIEEYSPGLSKSPKIKFVASLTLRELANIPKAGISKKELEKFDGMLKSIK